MTRNQDELKEQYIATQERYVTGLLIILILILILIIIFIIIIIIIFILLFFCAVILPLLA